MAEKTVTQSRPKSKNDSPLSPAPACNKHCRELLKRLDRLEGDLSECIGLVALLDNYIFRLSANGHEVEFAILPGLGILQRRLSQLIDIYSPSDVHLALRTAGVVGDFINE